MKIGIQILVFISLSLALVANSSERECKHKKVWDDKKMESLGLSEKQKKIFKAILSSHESRIKDLKDKKNEARMKIHQGFSSEKADSELIKLHKEIQGLRNQVSDKKFAKKMAIRKILTPQQRIDFHEMKGKGHGGKHKCNKHDKW